MGRARWSTVVLVAAVAGAGCGGGRSAVEVSAEANGSAPAATPTTSGPSATTPPAPGPTAATGAPVTTGQPPSTTRPTTPATTGAGPRPVRTTPTAPSPAPATTAATTPSTAAGTTTTEVPPTTAAPLRAPVLLDARQGFGTPCEPASPRNPAGCFFFVYATTATSGSLHRISSDAGFATDPLGTTCGTQSVHHSGEDTCGWYLGPVYGRTAGQTECFRATAVSGGRESEPSGPVCLTWADQTP